MDDPAGLPDGNTAGVYDVPVTVTYPDGTTDKTNVKVVVPLLEHHKLQLYCHLVDQLGRPL